jgi:hypothetical protein
VDGEMLSVKASGAEEQFLETENNKKTNNTMKSLILAQDKR